MNKNWRRVQIGNVLDRSEEWIDLAPAENYREVTVRLWGKGVMLRGETTGAEIAAKRRLLVRAGQFILSRIDARNGAFGVIPKSLDGAIVSNDFPVFIPNPSYILPSFLAWMSRTHDFVELCKAASEGTTNRVRLKEERFLSTEISLPPLDEQFRIVSRVEELSTKVDEARALRQQVAEELDALLVSALMHLQLPPGSTTKKICECSTMSTGTTPPSDRSDYYGGTIKWYTPGDLQYQQRLGASSRTLSEQALIERKARMFDPGTVFLVAIGGSLGKVALTHERCSANQQITGIKFSADILPEYGFWWMRRLGKALIAAAPQATLPIINQDRIGAFQISIPYVPEQRRIVAYLDDLQAKVDAVKEFQSETSAELDALMPSILAKAFRGEL